MGKPVERLPVDTVTSHVRNADPSRPDDRYGRSSIPIASMHFPANARGRVLPVGRRQNDVCGLEKLPPGGQCFWRSLCGKREAICFYPKCTATTAKRSAVNIDSQ